MVIIEYRKNVDYAPCPECGAEPIVMRAPHPTDINGEDIFRAVCLSCGARGENCLSVEKAAVTW